MTTRVTPSSASQSPSPSSAAVMVETVRTSCIRCRPRPGTRAQHTTSALATSSAATRSMISGSSVSTRIALASQSVHGGGHPWELQGKANLILVLEAHATAHSAAPGARLQDGLERPSHHDVDGRPRTIFGPERRSPQGPTRLQGYVRVRSLTPTRAVDTHVRAPHHRSAGWPTANSLLIASDV